MNKFLLKLYVTGDTPRAERAVANLRQICETELHDQYELIIVDVLENPQLAEKEKIMVTPTLVKELPPPRRRIIGDLTDTARVLLGLNLQPSADQHTQFGSSSAISTGGSVSGQTNNPPDIKPGTDYHQLKEQQSSEIRGED